MPRITLLLFYLMLHCVPAKAQDCRLLIDTVYKLRNNGMGYKIKTTNKPDYFYQGTKTLGIRNDSTSLVIFVTRKKDRVYLIGSGGHRFIVRQDTADTVLTMICHTPVHQNKVEFVFSNGDIHVHDMKVNYHYLSFMVPLKGMKRNLPVPLTFDRPFQRVYGDTTLLAMLLTHQLQEIRYSEVMHFTNDGKEVPEYPRPVTIYIKPEESLKLQHALQCLVKY